MRYRFDPTGFNKWFDTVDEPYRFMLFMAILIPVMGVLAFWPWYGLALLCAVGIFRISWFV